MTQEESTEQNLFLLRICYRKIVEVLDVLRSGLVIIENEKLNACYISLTLLIDTLLEDKNLEEFKKEKPDIYESLLSIDEEFSAHWNFLRSEVMQFIGKIDKRCLVLRVSDYRLPTGIKNLIEIVDKVIIKHKKLTKKESAKLIERAKYVRDNIIDFTPKKSEENEQKSLPTRIKVTDMPELKIKGFEEKVILQKTKNKRLQLREFPKNLRWEEITIKFINGEEVIITARNDTFHINYDVLGFQDEKKKSPNKQWDFLKLLAIKKGEISWENNEDLSLRRINSIKKQKQLLTEALKAYFQIENEPFLNYRKEKAYKIKINLIPEGDSTEDQEKKEAYEDDADIEIFRKKQAPEVYEE